MFKRFKSKRSPVIGVDISSTSIRALEISNTDEKYCIEGYGCEPLPVGAVEGHLIKDMNAVVSSLKNLFSLLPFSSKCIALAVPDTLVFSKVIQLSNELHDKEIEEFVAIEVDKMIAYPMNEVSIDFQQVRPSMEDSSLLDVLIVATAIDHVNSRVAAVTLAGLETKIVDIESYAIRRAVQHDFATQPLDYQLDDIVIVFDIKPMFVYCLALQNKQILFTRVEPSQRDIFLPIRNALQAFFSATQYSLVEHILVAGEGADFAALATLIYEETGIPTSEFNPIRSMSLAENVEAELILKASPALMIACGLALRSIEFLR